MSLMLLLWKACRDHPRIRKMVWKQVYQFLAHHYRDTDLRFMNYGYKALNPEEDTHELDPIEEASRYCIQLYHHVANAVDMKGRCVLEVGSGRGGGSSYLKRYLLPHAMVGVDLSEKAVALSATSHRSKGLFFIPADAGSLPFGDDTFDVVVNVESSHCYPSMDAFLGEVARVLRPSGSFLFADFRGAGGITALRDELTRSGMATVRECDITANVAEALALDSARKLQFIRRKAPRLLWGPLEDFWGVEGSQVYMALRSGAARYLSFVLQKSALV